MVQIYIYKVWDGENPPTNCPIEGELLELFSTGPPDSKHYQGGTWKCPKCERYYAWAKKDDITGEM